jgi:hypothetical protein
LPPDIFLYSQGERAGGEKKQPSSLSKEEGQPMAAVGRESKNPVSLFVKHVLRTYSSSFIFLEIIFPTNFVFCLIFSSSLSSKKMDVPKGKQFTFRDIVFVKINN